MFAFAIWDSRVEKLFIARDRIGIKPLHYTVLGNKSLVFGSEIKAILQDDTVPRRVNPSALSEYISLLYVPDPSTMFDGIRSSTGTPSPATGTACVFVNTGTLITT